MRGSAHGKSLEGLKVRIGTLATVVFIILMTFMSLFGRMGKFSYTPKILDELFGFSQYVLKETARKVDSGYCGNISFTPSEKPKNSEVLFYAQSGQIVRITIKATARGSSITCINISIDGVPWCQETELPYQIVQGTISDKLRFDREPGGDIHVVRFAPSLMALDAEISIDCLVLVSNY